MTNEELISRLADGDESALAKLCSKNDGLIRVRAKEIAKSYNCFRYTKNYKLDAYTADMIEDLCGVGYVAFIECIRSGNYNREKGLLTTFVTPFIDGAMRRHMETSLGTLSLDRDDMAMARNAQRLYNSEYMDVGEIAAELNISDKDAVRYISYATHFLGFEDLSDDDSDVFEYLLEDKSAEDPALIIYRRERMKLFKELFDALPKKDRDILGKCYGVFGYQKEPLKSIAMYHLMKVDAVEKSKNTAIKKVRKAYVGSMMQLWDDVHRLMRRPIFSPRGNE